MESIGLWGLVRMQQYAVLTMESIFFQLSMRDYRYLEHYKEDMQPADCRGLKGQPDV